MSLNLANRNLLDALSIELKRASGYARRKAQTPRLRASSEDSLIAVSILLELLGDACNEARNRLEEKDLAACGTDTRTSE